jgi:polyphosphate kinase
MVQIPLFDRDYSWLSFNDRVLSEAADPQVPLYERIKFLAIYSSNLDEFFRVRVAALRSIVDIDKKKINRKFPQPPAILLDKILLEVHRQQEEFGRIKREKIIPELKENGIFFYREEEIFPIHKEFAEQYFKSKILSHLEPVLMMSSETEEVHLNNRELYHVVDMISPAGTRYFAHLNIPSDKLPRFIELPRDDTFYYYIALDDIIREHVSFLFPGYTIKGCYSIKLNRDADLNIDDEFSGNLVKKIKKQVTKRNLGVPSRFLYDQSMPAEVLQYLIKAFSLSEEDLVPGGRYHNMHDLFQLPNPLAPSLENIPFSILRREDLDGSTMKSVMDKGDVMLHFPYQTYDYVLRYFNEAAFDPEVEEIKATFYRIAPDSFVSTSLIAAARNGKKVTVFVEIKARFDEANNIKWAEKMENAGIRIIYSIPGLKVHAKVAMITRLLSNGVRRRYAFLGTGNFNEKTATIYADEALLTINAGLTAELEKVFEYLEFQRENLSFNRLLVSQFNITDVLHEKIDQEIKNVRSGKKGKIILKLNNIQDDKMIARLYEAAEEGVEVELIIRAICCVVPRENLVIRRIVDRFLEHSRVYYFYNDGKEDLYMGSADWMKRNLYRRIEVVYPLYDESVRKEILKMIEIQLNDNVKATYIDKELKNIRVNNDLPPIQAQKEFHDYLTTRKYSETSQTVSDL